MEWLINQAFIYTGDWGLAILIVSVLIRTLLVPLNLKQMVTVYKQKELTPRIEKIKEKYKDNKDKMNEKLMELYKKEGASYGGCILSLLQIPVFFIVFRTINALTITSGSILIPWAISLGNADPLHILPVMYGIIQVASGLLRSDGKNLMQTLPFILLVVFLWNSSVSLWIYWIVNGVFSVGEGLYFKYVN